MKLFLTLTACFEFAIGLALIVVPSMVASLLLGVSLAGPGGILIARICGAAILSLAVACWFAKTNRSSSILVIKALVAYNTLAALLLAYGGWIERFPGIGLWPAVALHTILLIWSVQILRNN